MSSTRSLHGDPDAFSLAECVAINVMILAVLYNEGGSVHLKERAISLHAAMTAGGFWALVDPQVGGEARRALERAGIPWESPAGEQYQREYDPTAEGR